MDKTITFELDMTDNEHAFFYDDLISFKGVSKVALGCQGDFREEFDEFPSTSTGMGGTLSYRVTADEEVIKTFEEKLKEGYKIVYKEICYNIGARLKSKNMFPPTQRRVQFSYSGKNAKKICEWMYEGSNKEIRMERKYKKFKEYFK